MLKKTLLSAVLLLMSAQINNAAPPPSAGLSPALVPVAQSPAAQVVQQYLADTSSGQFEQAYALLSPATQKLGTLLQFESLQKSLTKTKIDHVPRLVKILASFIYNLHAILPYQFHVLGSLPNSPETVLVSVYNSNTSNHTFIDIMLTQSTDKKERIDYIKTYKKMFPPTEQELQMDSLKNLRAIGLAILQYALDHNKHFPDADHWEDEIMPYLKNQSLFHDPYAPKSQVWSYAFNRNLSGASLDQVKYPSVTIEVYQTTSDLKNANGTGAFTPVPIPGNDHSDIAYLFADGHAVRLPNRGHMAYGLTGQ